jgi:hypothetical protein
VGLLLVGLLAISQIFMPPKGFAVTALAAADVSASSDLHWLLDAAARSGVTPEGSLPLMGSPEAPHVVIFFHQYTCPHCRQMHRHLRDAVARYGNQLAVLVLPYAPDISAAATQPSCVGLGVGEYARLALAVWRLKKEEFADFEDYLRSSPPPMLANAQFPDIISLDQARRKVASIVTEQALADALHEPTFDDILTRLARALEALSPPTSDSAAGQALVPTTRLGETVIVGEIDPDSLYRQIETAFKISPVDNQAHGKPSLLP